MRILSALALTASAASLVACSSVEQAVRGPELAPIGYPAVIVGASQQVAPMASARDPAPYSHAANSLWRSGARAFFADQRAARVGDILTVQIDIDDSATTTNSTDTSRSSSSSLGIPHLFGLENSISKIFPSAYDPANAIETASDHSNSGSGSITRQEKISLTVAAIVTQVLPNGNMVIQGTQEVRTNREVRQLTVAGIIRPEDITPRNTIAHEKIAELRVAYGGRGQITDVQQPRYGQQVLDVLLPF